MKSAMNVKRIAQLLIAITAVACLAGYGMHWYQGAHDPYEKQMKILLNPNARGQWAFGMYRASIAQDKEWEIMEHNLNFMGELPWDKLMGNNMLLKANWLADRLNLPINRPIQPWQVQNARIGTPIDAVLHQYPSWIPDTIYGMGIFNTNASRLKRILALKFGINGYFDTQAYHFSFTDGQCDCIARQSENDDDPENLDEIMAAPHVRPPPLKTTEIYQIATNWLAAIGVNLDMLEKSRLPHPVRQEEHQFPGAPRPQPVYFVAWGTNYYGINYIHKFVYTNEWQPSVLVEIGPQKQLLLLSVGDLTYYRNPPMLIPSETVWRTLHTPDPPREQLLKPGFMAQFFCTLSSFTNRPDNDYILHYLTNSIPWRYANHLPVSASASNEFAKDNSELIPYTNSP